MLPILVIIILSLIAPHAYSNDRHSSEYAGCTVAAEIDELVIYQATRENDLCPLEYDRDVVTWKGKFVSQESFTTIDAQRFDVEGIGRVYFVINSTGRYQRIQTFYLEDDELVREEAEPPIARNEDFSIEQISTSELQVKTHDNWHDCYERIDSEYSLRLVKSRPLLHKTMQLKGFEGEFSECTDRLMQTFYQNPRPAELKLNLPNHMVTLSKECGAGCRVVNYYGVSKSSGNSIELDGQLIFDSELDLVTGFEFRNGNIRYLVAPDGTLTVVSDSGSVLLDTWGTWLGVINRY